MTKSSTFTHSVDVEVMTELDWLSRRLFVVGNNVGQLPGELVKLSDRCVSVKKNNERHGKNWKPDTD